MPPTPATRLGLNRIKEKSRYRISVSTPHRRYLEEWKSQKNSRRLELSISKTPCTEGGTRSRQCRPKVPGRFAFPGARNPRIYSISRSGKFLSRTPEQTPETATAFSSFLKKAPTPKTRFGIWTLLRTAVHFTTKMSVVRLRPFSVLSKDEIGN